MPAAALKMDQEQDLARGPALAERRQLKADNARLISENKRLQKQIDELTLQGGLLSVIPRPLEQAAYSDRIIPELRTMADQGATQTEWLAAWDISEDKWNEWCASTPLLQEEAARARVRARAVFEALFRRALMAGDRTFPFAKWVEIMNQRYGIDDKEAKGNANDVQSKGGRCEVCRDIILED